MKYLSEKKGKRNRRMEERKLKGLGQTFSSFEKLCLRSLGSHSQGGNLGFSHTARNRFLPSLTATAVKGWEDAAFVPGPGLGRLHMSQLISTVSLQGQHHCHHGLSVRRHLDNLRQQSEAEAESGLTLKLHFLLPSCGGVACSGIWRFLELLRHGMEGGGGWHTLNQETVTKREGRHRSIPTGLPDIIKNQAVRKYGGRVCIHKGGT